MLRIKKRNEITTQRILTTTLLIGVESFLIPLNNTLATGTYPSLLQVCQYTVTAILQVTTMLLAFYRREGEEG